jgi:3-hydroxybutyryl-CoA dehydrogenase
MSTQIKKVAVIGSGSMGSSLAQVFAMGGLDVVFIHGRYLGHAMELIGNGLKTLAEFGAVREADIPAILARIHPFELSQLEVAVEGVQFVIESASETAEVKKPLLEKLDAICPPSTILASNTSNLDVFNLVQLKYPERMVAAHFYGPAYIIPLVEVAPGPLTSVETVLATRDLMTQMGKWPIVMKKFAQGYLVNKLQQAITDAVFRILEDDLVDPADLDLAVKLSLGIRLPFVGVVQTLDFAGLPLCVNVLRGQGKIIPFIEERVKQGLFGVQTSAGIYDYGGRSEGEILRKRDLLYLKQLEHLKEVKGFEPI